MFILILLNTKNKTFSYGRKCLANGKCVQLLVLPWHLGYSCKFPQWVAYAFMLSWICSKLILHLEKAFFVGSCLFLSHCENLGGLLKDLSSRHLGAELGATDQSGFAFYSQPASCVTWVRASWALESNTQVETWPPGPDDSPCWAPLQREALHWAFGGMRETGDPAHDLKELTV